MYLSWQSAPLNRLGLDASNGYGIAQKINSFIMLIPASLIQCMASFVAQNVGAKKEDRAKRGMYYGMSLGFCIGLFIAAFAFFRGDLLATVFTSDPQAIAKAFEYLRGLAPEAFLTCILFSFMGYFNGHARSTFVMVQGLIQSFLIRLPISWYMSIQEGASLTGIGLAVPVSTSVGILLCWLYYRRLNRQIQAMHR